MSGAGNVVCVTGASGYVASWVVKLLLERGYTVKATVRNLIDGCEGVFHTASPVFLTATDPKAEIVEPAVKGTLNVLGSCGKAPSVRRVVVTSSTSSVSFNRNHKGPDVIVDETWFSDAAFCEETELWYPLSKTLAEEAAWKYAQENGIDLVTMHPGYVIGPLLQPTLNFTSQAFLDLIKGRQAAPFYRFVDVRDVAYAHIMAFENPSASGRYCLVGKALSYSEAQQMMNKLYPSLNLPIIGTENPIPQVSKKKAESLGIHFTPTEVSIKDTVESLMEKNFLSL